MSILTDLENDVKVIGGDLKAKFTALESDAKTIMAMVNADLKKMFTAAEGAVVKDIQAILPQYLSALKTYALEVVQSIENSPTYSGAAGSWKFGAAAGMLFTAVKSGLIGPALHLTQGTIETLIQNAFKDALSAGVLAVAPVAAPTSAPSSSASVSQK